MKILLIVLVLAAAAALSSASSAGDAPEEGRERARRLHEDGNYREAEAIFRRLALDPATPPREAAEDLRDALECLHRLGALPEALELLDNAAAAHPESWRILSVAASPGADPAAVSHRPARRSMPRAPQSETLRARALLLLLEAERHLDNPGDPASAEEQLAFFNQFEQALRTGRADGNAWRLTALTDLSAPAEAADDQPFWAFPERGAPVDENGDPVYYRAPASWDGAKNDGERWRWILGRMERLGEKGKAAADLLLGDFLLGQFGVQTMRETPGVREAELAGETGPFAVRTLGEGETIARLAGGLKRFAMPEEFNHILLLRRVADAGDAEPRRRALALLASVFENRQQYPKAAELWRRLLREKDAGGHFARTAEEALARIAANSGALEPGDPAPAGKRSTLAYLFRNGDQVSFTATRLDERKLLADIRDRLKAGDSEFFENYLYRRPETLGRFVFEDAGARYLGAVAAEWELSLQPLPDHFSRRIDVEVPVDTAGCYLVEARMRDGNTSRVVLWIADLALVRRDTDDGPMVFVADAGSGEPVAGAVVSFLWMHPQYNTRGKRTYAQREFAEKTDGDGLIFLPSSEPREAEWLLSATTEDGKFAYLGFDYVWTPSSRAGAEEDERTSAFLLTDRPVYRPGQPVRFKAWIGRAAYAPRPGDSFAGRPVRIGIHNPRGDVVHEQTLAADAYGGVDGSFTPEEGAALGQYFISLQSESIGGGAAFRVEEYKKLEFEVALDAPDHALALGDSVQLKVRAAYYHGAPVTDAKVAYRILRTPHRSAWTPPWRWDWLYGAGAWRTEYARPGRIAPGIWPPFSTAQPELVAEGEGRPDAEGVFRFTLDTAPAKALFSHQDHAYEISFDVTDASRRTISGSGRVIASREPFAVSVWTERGYFRAGEEIRAEIRAAQPLGGGVAARGSAALYRISHADPASPAETEVERREVGTEADGSASLRFRAGGAGQYRLVVRLRGGAEGGAEGALIEGSALLTVRGAAEEGDFRFSPLELVPEKREYAPGETLRLAVHSENSEGVVLLFPRAERGEASARPRVVRLRNGSHMVDLDVGRADQPNFFCEALTVFGGKTYSETREIFVPPADKTLSVRVTADREHYRPGETATFSLAVTDAEGNPVAAQCAVALYDKSVEYIAGGPNAGDIRAAFWSWKRFHHAAARSSLDRSSYPVAKNDDKPWLPIGAFGGEEADWNGGAVLTNGAPPQPRVRAMRMQADSAVAGGMLETALAVSAPAPIAADQAAYAAVPAAGAAEAKSFGADAGGMAEASVRSEFADTAFWTAALETDDDGRASFTVAMPENLTAWIARVWVMGAETRVGAGVHEVVTRKNVLVRPQTPRFLTQKDQVVLSANLHNYLPRAKRARAELVLEGGLLEPAEGTELVREIDLAANGEARADWLVDARRPGTATVVMRLLTDEESDAAEIFLPVIVHGARRVEGFSAVIRPDEERRVIRFTVPEERLADRSRLEFSFSPSIAASLLEALPFLIEYPYGCTEQTLNRFLPAVTVRKYLDTLGVSLPDAKAMRERSAAREDAQSAAWRERLGDGGASPGSLPVFDDRELDAVVRLGVERLAGMQNADGGWGWFSGAGEQSWPHTTAVVVHGLQSAEEAGAAVPAGVIEGGLRWLAGHQAKQIALLRAFEDGAEEGGEKKEKADSLDAFVHLVLRDAARGDPAMRRFLYRDRLVLPLTGLAMLGLALEREGRGDELAMVLRNLSQFVETNRENATAWLRTPARGWWLWYNDEVETQAWYLQLLAKTEPRSELASGVAKYLLQNRKNGSRWRSTRDTAYAIGALTRYAAASGETEADMTVKLYLDGKLVRERRLTRDNLLEDNRFILEGLAVEAGGHELAVERTGRGALYCGGSLSVFSLEDPIAAAGGDLRVSRAFYKLAPSAKKAEARASTGAAARVPAEGYERTPLPGPFAEGADGVPVAPGDLIEAELTIAAANDYEYLVFEDMKAAGLEAVELRSGYAGNASGAYVEYRDQKVVLFLRFLPKGTHTLAYRFRAETPGTFSALPVFGGGMYATDLFCNSDEMKLRVTE